jgi:hypothetical protein
MVPEIMVREKQQAFGLMCVSAMAMPFDVFHATALPPDVRRGYASPLDMEKSLG